MLDSFYPPYRREGDSVETTFKPGPRSPFSRHGGQTRQHRPCAWLWICGIILGAYLLLGGQAWAGDRSPNRVVLTAAEIRHLNVHTIQDLLNLVPGVQATSSTVSIRGSSEVRVLLDGLPLNNAVTAATNIRWNLVSLPAVRKVVILKGGGSVVHGDDSSGGVISIFTRRLDQDRGYAQVSFGGLGIQDHQLQVSRAGATWGLRADAAYYHSDGFRLNNDKTIWRFGIKSSISPASWKEQKARGLAGDPSLSVNYSQTERGLAGLPAFPHPQARERQQDLAAAFAFKYSGVSFGTYFTNFRKNFSNPPKHLFTDLESVTLRQDVKGQAELGLVGKVGWGLSLQGSRARGSDLDPVTEQGYGLFATKKISLESLPLSIDLGLRGNLYSDFDSALNPEIELTLALGALSLHGGLVMSNNVPSFVQRFYRSSTTEPNPDLDLERSTNLSLGATYQAASRWQAQASLFHNTVDDRITYIRGDGGVGRYQNLGKAILQGLDVSLACRPWPWLRFQAAYGYLDAKDDSTGLWLPGKSRHNARLDVQVLPWLDLKLGVKMTYSSQAFTRADNSETAPAYYTVDLRAEYLVNGFRIYAKVDNLLDKDYLTGDGFPGPPRVWRLGVSLDF